jgi:uncharacterized protein (DUF302 family)
MSMMDKMMDAMVGSMKPSEKQDMMLEMMPQMGKNIKSKDVFNLLMGTISDLMFSVHKSKLDFEKTVSAIEKAGKEGGWYNPVITDHYKIEKELGYKDANKVTTISMCRPHSAHKILKIDENKKLAVMMPMQINVYETADGQVHVAWMNIKLMGKMFGAEVAKIMGEADKNLQEVHKEIIEGEGGQNGHDG